MENKTSKYFKYAIGEIILVVIGILIALQINNWNEAGQKKEKEILALTEILSDLKFTIEELERIKRGKTYNLLRSIKSLKILIKELQMNQPYRDSLGIYFDAAFAYDNAQFKTSGYSSLNSIGMDLVEDAKIRSSIGQFYTSTIGSYNSVFREIEMDFHEYLLDFIRKDFSLINMETEKRALVPNDYETLKKNKEYIQSMRTFLDMKNLYLNKLNITKTRAIQLEKEIETYIND